jgi:hypothetical protein
LPTYSEDVLEWLNNSPFSLPVLAEKMRETLHNSAKNVGLGHQVFSRPLVGQRNPIEKTLDSILAEIGDESKYVEYWARQEWRSIEAHADVDEFLAKKQDVAANNNSSDFRYPTNGHVLYLKVGSAVRGPTCVFPGRRSGKDLLLNPLSGSEKSGDIELVTIPAVPGRLLRFEGDSLHAVPRPANLWLLKFVKGAPQYEPEEEWGRSVVLFNTWDGPPLDVVPIDSSTSDDDSSGVCNELSEWGETYVLPKSASEDVCKDDERDADSRVPAKIWLLGNLRRRGHPLRTLKLFAPPNLSDALQESTTVTRVVLDNNDG